MNQIKIPHNTKRILLLALVVLSILSVLLFGRSVRLPDQAVICGMDVSGMSHAKAESLLAEAVDSYRANITVGDQSFTITAEDIGLSLLSKQFKAVVKTAAKNETTPDSWSVITLDRDKLLETVSQKFREKRTAAALPLVVFDEAANCFRTMPGEPETWYSSEILGDLLLEHIAKLSTEIHISEDLLYQQFLDPQKQAAAEALAQTANQLMEQELEYKFRPRNYKLGEITLDSSTIASFLRFDVEKELIYTDRQAVSTYVEYIAPQYNYNKLKDRFLAHDGGRIKSEVFIQPQTVDKEKFVDLIAQTVTAGSSGSFEVPYNGGRNFEGTYIEVSIPDQHLWYYKDNELVLDTPVVTGFEGIGHFTPVGINYVRGHFTNIELFKDSFVEYCMPFTSGGTYCLHDADHWREPEEYGGVTYQSHGSGGCVNIPVANMCTLYELVEDGTPVMIHHYYHYDKYSFPE